MTREGKGAVRAFLLRCFFHGEMWIARTTEFREAAEAVGYRVILTPNTKTLVWAVTGEIVGDPWEEL